MPRKPTAASDEEWASTNDALANALQVDRRQISRWLKREGRPLRDSRRGWRIAEWLAWVAENAKPSLAGRIDHGLGSLQEWLTYEQARKHKLANDTKESRLILRTEHERIISKLIAEVSAVLQPLPDRLAPLVVGVSVPDAHAILQKEVDNCFWKLRHEEAPA
jgi:phage terminase Nu1 subunit (DNA packaging protein)